MLRHACTKIDEAGCPAFVTSTNQVLELYKKFGFSIVSEFETWAGTFTKMKREAWT